MIFDDSTGIDSFLQGLKDLQPVKEKEAIRIKINIILSFVEQRFIKFSFEDLNFTVFYLIFCA